MPDNFGASARTRIKFGFLVLVGTLALTACSVTQLKDQTVSVGSSVGPIYTSQVLKNLYRLAADKNAVPSHFTIQKGSINTTNSIAPTLALPLGNQVTRGLIATQNEFGVTGIQTSGRSLGLGTSEGWNQSWDIEPADDPRVLEILNSIYNYVLGNIGESDDVISQLRGKTSTNPELKMPSMQDAPTINYILDKCWGCFKIRAGEECISTAMATQPMRAQILTDWVCLGEYSSLVENIIDHELLIRNAAYQNKILLKLVDLWLQLKSEAPKPKKPS